MSGPPPGVDVGTASIEPNGENSGIHDELHGIHRGFYPAAKEQMRWLAEAQMGGKDAGT